MTISEDEKKSFVAMDPEVDLEMDPEMDPSALDASDEDILDKTLSASFTEETQPLVPSSLQSINLTSGENLDENLRKEELKFQLKRALQKLEQFENSVDANTSLDNSITRMKDDYATMEMFPSHVANDVKGIISSAEDYIAKLEGQLVDLDIADQQIIKSASRVMQEIDNTYQDLLNRVCHKINKRRDLMRLEAEVYMTESLGPLKACRQQVNAAIRSSRHLINELSLALLDTDTKKPQECKIIEASSHLGRIPAVPQPEELPYVTFGPPSKSAIDATVRSISELGSVLRMGPTQIVAIEERPGALYVKWQITDPEYTSDEQIFVVQKANGEVYDVTSNAFEIVYEGPETSCFVRDLRVDEPVTLRVGLKNMETAWSAPRFAKTRILPYNWSLDNKDYMVTNGGKVAAKITERLSTLFSTRPQVDANQIIEFTFLEVSQDVRDSEGVALLSDKPSDEEDLRSLGSLVITPLGKIFMDGAEKLMRLPRIRLGSRIIFTIDRKDEETLRISVESREKAVTYDWAVRTPLYFAARFRDFNKWNLMVK